MRPRGELAIVLHTHMPYVEGYGTWPFGEEWLWEAAIHSYLPLLDLLEKGAPLTLSLTPVLCDQLLADGIADRFLAFIEEVRSHTFAADQRELEGGAAAELERAWQADYLAAAAAVRQRQASLGQRLLAHATLTSAATHAVLPLLATRPALRAQVRVGVEGFRERAARWGGGFWLPECAHAPWLEPVLAEEGVRFFLVEWTERFGRGAREQLSPRRRGQLVAVPIEREAIDLVWGADGYPGEACYRSTHRRSGHGHCPWANDGSVYDPQRARARARDHARDFARAVVAKAGEGPLLALAFDTELFGLWWYEGIWFLEGLCEALAELPVQVVALEEAAALAEPPPDEGEPPPTSWGKGGDLRTWSSATAEVAALAGEARRLELAAVGAGLDDPAVRHLLAAQASDWTYMVANDLAADYGRRRFAEHRQAVEEALAGSSPQPPRNLAPFARAAVLREP